MCEATVTNEVSRAETGDGSCTVEHNSVCERDRGKFEEEGEEPKQELSSDANDNYYFSTESRNSETQSAAEVEQPQEKQRSKSPSPPQTVPHKKQRSLKSLFEKQLKTTAQSQVAPTDLEKNEKTSLISAAAISSSLPPAPKLSSVEEFVVGTTASDETAGESRVLTPLEQFQLKLMGQMAGPPGDITRGVGREREREREAGVDGGRMEAGGEETGEDDKIERGNVQKPLISDDVISKLKSKPGTSFTVFEYDYPLTP